jgi:hypothetical protein
MMQLSLELDSLDVRLRVNYKVQAKMLLLLQNYTLFVLTQVQHKVV